MLGVIGLVKLMPAEDQAELDRILSEESESESSGAVGDLVGLKQRIDALEAGREERRALERELVQRVRALAAKIDKRLQTVPKEGQEELHAMRDQIDHLLEGIGLN